MTPHNTMIMNDLKQLGNYFRAVFTINGLDEAPRQIIKSHHFILMRYLSIMYPLQIDELNRVNVDQYSASMYMHKMMSKLYTRSPQWLWIKYNKEKNNTYMTLKKLKSAAIMYMNVNMMGTRDFYYEVNNNRDQLISKLKQYDKLITENGLDIAGNLKLDINMIK